MKKIFLLFSLILLVTPLLWAISGTTYYSKGNNLPPNNTSSWVTNTDGTGTNPTDFTNSSDVFNIQAGHTMITSAAWTPAGNINISGTLVASNSITVGGTLTVQNGGTYQHNQDGGTIPAATWQTGSTCVVTGVVTTVPGGLIQSFYNFTWSSANTAAMSFAPIAINGNLNITAGGSGTNTLGISSTPFTIAGNLNLSGTANFVIQTGGSYKELDVAGSFSLSSGTLNLSNGTAQGNLYIGGNFSHTNGTITETGSVFGFIIFNGSGSQIYTSGGIVSNTIKYEVFNGATLQMASPSTVVPGYDFYLDAGGTLGITSAAGITSSGASGNIQSSNSRNFDAGATYLYNGTVNQNTGSGLPNNLTGILNINNSGNTVTLNTAETIANSGTVMLTNGTFAAGTNLTMASTSGITRGGGNMTGTLQGSGSYNVIYNGSSKTTGPELNNSGLQNVTMNLTSGQTLTAGGSITVNGIWTISSGTTFDAGSFTHNLKGNWSNSGTLTGNTSTFNMSGSGAQTMSGSTFNNLTINNPAGVTMLTDETVDGTLALANGSFNISSNTLNINGAISVGSGSLVGGSSSNITFGGTGASTTLPAITLNNLTMNRGTGITLGGAVTVDGKIDLSNGIISPSGFNLTAASTINGNTNSFVSGPLNISGGAATEFFPIGKGSDYRPVTLSGVTGTNGSTVISAESFNSGSGGTAAAPLINLSSVSYWFIQVTTSTFSSATVTMTYDATDGVNDNAHLGLGQSSAKTGTYQNYSGTLGGSGTPTGTISTDGPVTALGYFTLGNITGGFNALPVELTSFTASVSENTVNLKWSTATEVNNYGFDVERSTDNKTWTKIGFVAGAVNSSSPKNYSYTDQPDGGTSFSYRLKQIDVGGAYKYYDPISVSLTGGDKAQLMQNSPNPFNPSTTIKYYIPQAMVVTLKIYDILGREITTLVNQQAEAGYHIIYWNGRDNYGSSVSSGIYLYRLQAGNFVETKKMIMMK